MSILVVDDSSTMRRIIINSLNRLGFKNFHEASNGREGLERLAGVKNYLVKPFTPDTIREKVQAALLARSAGSFHDHRPPEGRPNRGAGDAATFANAFRHGCDFVLYEKLTVPPVPFRTARLINRLLRSASRVPAASVN